MKVAIASHGLFPDDIGGMERHTYNLARHLAKIGIEAHVLVPEKKGRTRSPFPVHQLPWPPRPLWLWSNRAFSEEVGRWIDREKPDLAFGQGFNLWKYLKRKSVPCVFHPHGLEMFASEKMSSIPFRKLVRFHGKYSDLTISLGGRLTDILKDQANIPPERIVEIPNAVDLDEFPLGKSGRELSSFLFVGRFAFNKGIDLLEQALDYGRDLDFTLTMAGDGPLRGQVQSLCKRDDRVKCILSPSDKQLRELYRSNEILLFTSRFEGMPTVILEAMASGCAVVATRIGAVETMVSDATGILVEPEPHSLADGIRKCLKLPVKTREKMGEAGRRVVEDRFAWDRVVQSYKRLFDSILNI